MAHAEEARPISDGAPPSSTPGRIRIAALSTKARYVTGGDVLIRVSGVPSDSQPLLTVNGAKRHGALALVTGGSWSGLIDGLPEGRSVLTVTAGNSTGRLNVTNHPLTGPLFSGPQRGPLTCTTERNGLGAPTDADCSAGTAIRWNYVDVRGAVRSLSDPTTLPADVATVTVMGRSVPFLIRTESGTMNRSVYWISVIDPTPASNGWEGVSDGWNEDLIYRFGGGCGTSYSQGEPMVGDSRGAPTIDPDLLSRGYAVATATFNTFQVQCNDVLSAETMAMVKEHFIEHYGLPDRTIGEGGSGGSIQQQLIAQDYPGLLDALEISVPFPDALSIAPGVTDCGLLEHFYSGPDGSGFTDAQRTAVNGHAVSGTCGNWDRSFLDNLDPTTGCDLPAGQIYNATTNPTGTRCTLQDANVNTLGKDPATGFAVRPLDNVGIQYGLNALEAKVITVDQFLDLNERIGGFDIDGGFVPEREKAEQRDLRHMYSSGRINLGAGDLRHIPIIAINDYSDPTGDIHDRWRVFQIQDRLRTAGGADPANLSIWTVPGGSLGAALAGGSTAARNQAIDALGEWLDNLHRSPRPRSDQAWFDTLRSTRPASAANRCTTPDGVTITGTDIYTADNACTRAYPVAGDPRTAAGAPMSSTVGKCRLEMADPGSYGVPFTEDQQARLRSIFSQGVCDWSRPGIGQTGVSATWIDYGT